MLGYVRCQAGEMLVKHHALYRAMYCGLCHTIQKHTTRAQLPFLSYDFVFLALIHSLVNEDPIVPEKQFCLFHPFSKEKKRIKENDALRYSAAVSLFLTKEKLLDDRLDGDHRALSCLFAYPFSHAEKRLFKKEKELLPLSKELSRLMKEGREAESRGADLDEMCNHFGNALSLIFSYPLEGDKKRLLAGIGASLGRFLYVLDALDDLEKDEKSGSFNPILQKYGSVSQAKEHFPEIDLVLSYEISQMKALLDLLSGDKDLMAILLHIVTVGLPSAQKRVLQPKTEK